jgi:hypothetical protein
LRFAGPLAGASQRLASSADLAACRQQHAKAVTGPAKNILRKSTSSPKRPQYRGPETRGQSPRRGGKQCEAATQTCGSTKRTPSRPAAGPPRTVPLSPPPVPLPRRRPFRPRFTYLVRLVLTRCHLVAPSCAHWGTPRGSLQASHFVQFFLKVPLRGTAGRLGAGLPAGIPPPPCCGSYRGRK